MTTNQRPEMSKSMAKRLKLQGAEVVNGVIIKRTVDRTAFRAFAATMDARVAAEPAEPICRVCELPGSKCGCEPNGVFE
jgi:hypothetical protein